MIYSITIRYDCIVHCLLGNGLSFLIYIDRRYYYFGGLKVLRDLPLESDWEGIVCYFLGTLSLLTELNLVMELTRLIFLAVGCCV